MFEVQNAVGWLFHVRVTRDESERVVERLGVDHRRECVQHDSFEAKLACVRHEVVDESTAETACSLFRIDVEAADLADVIADEQCDYAQWRASVVDGEQNAAWVGVERSELHELRGDVIESSADLRVGRELGHCSLVGAEQSPDSFEVFVG